MVPGRGSTLLKESFLCYKSSLSVNSRGDSDAVELATQFMLNLSSYQHIILTVAKFGQKVVRLSFAGHTYFFLCRGEGQPKYAWLAKLGEAIASPAPTALPCHM